MSAHEITVYGATGYTGRLVCARLAAMGADFAIAGRDPRKLEALARRLGGAASREIIVAPLEEPAALVRMASRARVVLDCAGPFARFGRPVQDAAIEAGAHFLDITGEHPWMRETFARDAEARDAGVALINAVGFDVVPTDAAAALAAEAAGAPIARVRIGFATRGARPTQGTTRSALEAAHLGGLAFVDGAWRVEPVGAELWEVPFREPIGTRLCPSVPWGDVATAPRTTGAREVRTFTSVPRRALKWLPAARALAPVLGWPPVAAFAERRVRRLPEGPTDAERATGVFAVHAEAQGARGTHAIWVTGRDGYDFTAASAAWCARAAADPSFKKTGALTPTQAFGARTMLDALAADGVAWG